MAKSSPWDASSGARSIFATSCATICARCWRRTICPRLPRRGKSSSASSPMQLASGGCARTRSSPRCRSRRCRVHRSSRRAWARSGERPSGAQFLHPLRDAGSLLDLFRAGRRIAPVHDSGGRVVADGSLVNMANYRHEGYECCGGGNIVANTETFLPAHRRALFGDEGPIRISTVRACLARVRACAPLFPVADHRRREHRLRQASARAVLAGRGRRRNPLRLHPSALHDRPGLAKYRRKHFANIDYGMIPRMFAHPGPHQDHEIRSEAYVNNFTARRPALRDDRQALRRRGLPALP